MARAKRTDRTEARRRYRAEQVLPGGDPTTDDIASAPAKPRGVAPQHPAPARPGIVASFRNAYRPLDLRGDLAVAPGVLTHWGVLVAAAIAVVATAVFIASTSELASSLDFSLSNPMEGKTIGTASNISYLAVSMFVTPPPAAGAFLIGFTARRASWLGGMAFGLVAAACYVVILASPAGRLLTSGRPADQYIFQALTLAPVGAALFAAAAAWYRRFLDLANPNRGRPRPQQGRSGSRQKDRPLVSRAADKRR